MSGTSLPRNPWWPLSSQLFAVLKEVLSVKKVMNVWYLLLFMSGKTLENHTTIDSVLPSTQTKLPSLQLSCFCLQAPNGKVNTSTEQSFVRGKLPQSCVTFPLITIEDVCVCDRKTTISFLNWQLYKIVVIVFCFCSRSLVFLRNTVKTRVCFRWISRISLRYWSKFLRGTFVSGQHPNLVYERQSHRASNDYWTHFKLFF